MRESAGARVVRALCAWYAGALRTRASAGMPLKRKTCARQRARPSGAQKRGACPARGLRARRCVDGRGWQGGCSRQPPRGCRPAKRGCRPAAGWLGAGRGTVAGRDEGARGAWRGGAPLQTAENAPTRHHTGTFTVQWAEIPLPYYLTAERLRGAGRGLYKRKRQQGRWVYIGIGAGHGCI